MILPEGRLRKSTQRFLHKSTLYNHMILPKRGTEKVHIEVFTQEHSLQPHDLAKEGRLRKSTSRFLHKSIHYMQNSHNHMILRNRGTEKVHKQVLTQVHSLYAKQPQPHDLVKQGRMEKAT